MGRFKGNPGGACAAAGPLLAKLEPLAKGEIAALQVPKAPKLIAGLKFNRPDSTPAAISEFSGRTVLLNLWATWCVPCKAEMPALDKLQAELGAKDFEVVAVNIDTRNTDKARDWLKEAGISRLTHYTDRTSS